MKVVPIYSHGKPDTPENITGYCIKCPGCTQYIVGDNDLAQYHILDKRWQFNGDFERPTFSPSLLCHGSYGKNHEQRTCHSFITDGKIQFLGDSTHNLKNQTVDLPDNTWPDEVENKAEGE